MKYELNETNFHEYFDYNGNLSPTKLKKIECIPHDFIWCKNKVEYFYAVVNNLHAKPICSTCSNDSVFISYIKGYKDCKVCRQNERNIKTSESLKKFNNSVEHFIINEDNISDLLDNKNNPSPFKLRGGIIPLSYQWCDSKSEAMYCIFNKLDKKQTCKICNKFTKYVNFNVGYRDYCSRACQYIGVSDKRKITMKNRYGSEEPFACEEIIKKSKKTKQEKYGDEFYSNQEQQKVTNLEKYNVEFSFGSKMIQEKSQKTWVLNYGVDNPRKSKKIKAKIRKTKEELGIQIPQDMVDDFIQYRRKVYQNQNLSEIKKLSNYEKRGRLGDTNSYHMDHKFSIYQGFTKNILPCYIGHINNLEMLTAENNRIKGIACSITLEELIEGYNHDL